MNRAQINHHPSGSPVHPRSDEAAKARAIYLLARKNVEHLELNVESVSDPQLPRCFDQFNKENTQFCVSLVLQSSKKAH